MKIQMIAPTPFFAHRGCHVRILEEVRALAAAGHEIALCTYGLGEEVPGVETVRSPRVPWYRKLTAGPSWHKFYLDGLLLATALRFGRRFRPDVLHAHLHEGVFLAAPLARLLGGVPVLGDLQGSLTIEMSDHGFFDRWRWGERWFSRLEGSINRFPREVVASAAPVADEVRAARGRGDSAVTLLGDGVDASAFRLDPDARRAARAELGYGDGDRVVGYLGLLTPYQGVDLLLEVAARTDPSARFLIMGFPNEDAYRARAQALGLGSRARFTGRVRYEDAPRYLAAADTAVSLKLSATEANGKLLNYMAVGLPTVAFDTPTNRAILGDAGVYARHGDGEEVARILSALLADESRRRDLSRRLRRRAVDDFSWTARARQFGEIYSRLLARRTAADPAREAEAQAAGSGRLPRA